MVAIVWGKQPEQATITCVPAICFSRQQFVGVRDLLLAGAPSKDSSASPLLFRLDTSTWRLLLKAKPSVVICALSPSDETTVMCSALATWDPQLEHRGDALLPAFPLAVHFIPATLVAHLQVAFKAGCFTYGRWRSLLPSPEEAAPTAHFTVTNREVALAENSFNLVDCCGTQRPWLAQHSLWGSSTVIKALMEWGNSIWFL